MSEIGHAFSQPGVSCLDGRLEKHKGWSGGRGRQLRSMAPWPVLSGRGGWQRQPQRAFFWWRLAVRDTWGAPRGTGE